MSKPAGAGKPVLLVAFLTMFLDLVGFGIIIPIQPFYAQEFGASPTVVTLLGGSYSLMQFIFAPFWGNLSDKYGRKPILLVGIFFGIVGYILFGLAGSLGWLFMSRMLTGFGNANLSVAQAIVADVTDDASRAKGMGIIGAAFGLGFVVGPAIGGFLASYGPHVPAYAAAVFGVINFMLALVILPETLSAKQRTKRASLLRIREIKFGSLPFAMLMMVLIGVSGFAIMEQVISLFIEATFVTPDTSIVTPFVSAARLTAWYLVVVGLTAALVQGGLIRRWIPKFGEIKLFVVGVVLTTLSLALIPPMVGSGHLWIMLTSGFLVAFGMGLYNPTLLSLLSKSVDAEDQGLVMGLNQSMGALGRVIGPLVAGYLFERNIELPFYIAAIAFLATTAMAIRLAPRLSKA